MLRKLHLLHRPRSPMAVPAAAVAHVTLQPGEWEPGAFATLGRPRPQRARRRRDDHRHRAVPGVDPERALQAAPDVRARGPATEALAEPVEELTERIVSVTWTCDPAIPADGFDEFGISLRVPEDAEPGDEILFPAIQTYSSGEEVGWIDPDPEGDLPAPRLVVVGARGERPRRRRRRPRPSRRTRPRPSRRSSSGRRGRRLALDRRHHLRHRRPRRGPPGPRRRALPKAAAG